MFLQSAIGQDGLIVTICLPFKATSLVSTNQSTCDSLPDVTNGARLLEATQEDVYQLHDVVQYACVNETYEMIGTDSIACLYSGNWSHSPPKCLPVNKFGVESVYFVLLVISLLLLVVFYHLYGN